MKTKKTSLFENWKSLIGRIENMSPKDLNSWLYLFMILIVADLFGVYWYLNLKKIGLVLLLVLIFMLSFLLFTSRKSKQVKGGKKMVEIETKTKEKTEEEEEEDEEEEESHFDISKTGLPSSEEMQKRLDRALGTV